MGMKKVKEKDKISLESVGSGEKRFSLAPYIMANFWPYLLGIALLFAVDFVNLYVPQYTGLLIGGLADGTLGWSGVWHILLMILLFNVLMAAGRFGWRICIVGSARRIGYKLGVDMFGHLESLSASFYSTHKTGDLMAHFNNDLTVITDSCGWAVVTAFDAVVLTVMVLVKMVSTVSLKMTLVAVVPMVIIAIGCYFFGVEEEKRQTKRQDAFSALSDRAQESIAGIRVQKAFVQEQADYDAFQDSSSYYMRKNMAVVRLRALFGPALDFVIDSAFVVMLIVGGKLVLDGEISIAQFVMFDSYLGMLIWPMIACGDCINSFTQAYASFKRIRRIMDARPDVTDARAVLTPETEHIGGRIDFNNLTFTYPDGEEPVLRDINLHVQQGEMLGILARTGSGKSTLADLLLRVYDTDDPAQILIDGRPITDYPLAVLHRDIAYVPQENFLFSDTIEENIAFGEEKRLADDSKLADRVREAARAACVDDNIMEFPEGYRTMVGERGVTLSGGQKQRTSIARALLTDPSILVLDDALSAVDTDTEKEILANILRLRRGRTTIVIAHRISTLGRADHVAVLEAGEVAEYGTGEELLAAGGFYAETWRKQQLEEEIAKEV